ncbi:hypothetical protein PLICRDRAFT_120079, partial [Plicaturopsis crispa FD-325 SS-3]
FAEGSEAHAYSSLTVDRRRYSGPENIEPSSPTPPATYLARSINEPYLFLMNQNMPGKLHVAGRGKLLAVACGQHATLLSFGLQSSIIGMPEPTYRELLSLEQDSTNTDSEKAKILRSFRIPDRFTIAGSADLGDRKINIFAVFVSIASAWVWVVSDFNRIVQMHVISRDKPFEANDLKPGSDEWPRLWYHFKGSFDWIMERPFSRGCAPDMAANIELPSAIQRTPPPPEPLAPNTSIIVDMCGNTGGAFSGLGRHTANDLLYLLAIFPGMPYHVICSSNTLFATLKSGIAEYMDQLTKSSFLDDVSGSNDRYISGYIDVFRRTKGRSLNSVKDLYNFYMKEGLFDPDHTIGQPYPQEKWTLSKTQFKWMPAPIKAYTIICAKRPVGWKDGPQASDSKMLRCFGDFCYVTTIGLAQFRELVLNQVNIKAKEGASVVVKRGRPSKISVGFPLSCSCRAESC